jgi:hypothetical protein
LKNNNKYVSDWVKNSPVWKKLKKMDGDLANVTKEFMKYGDFLLRMQKIVSETEAEIDADDPDWRNREHLNLYGRPLP